MILANEQVAELLERKRVPAVYRVHGQPEPERVERLVAPARRPRHPGAAVRQGISRSEAAKIAAEASRLVAREAEAAQHGGQAYTSLVLRSLQAGPVQRPEQRPCRPRQPRLLPLHLADPPLPRPASSTGRCSSTLGQGEEAPEPRGGPRGRAPLHRARARRDEGRAPRRRRLRRIPAERELRERGPKRDFEGEMYGVIRAGAFIAFGGRAGRRLRGIPAGPPDRVEITTSSTRPRRRWSGADRQAGRGSAIR